MSEEPSQAPAGRAPYWLTDDVEVIDGQCWTLTRTLDPICLGPVDKLGPTLKGLASMPDDTPPFLRKVIEALLPFGEEEDKQSNGKPRTRTTGTAHISRIRSTGAVRHRKKAS